MKIHRPLLPFYFLLFFAACAPTQQPDSTNSALPYFDIKGLVEQQIEMLKKWDSNVRKSMSVNGKEEVLQSQTLDWGKELVLFSEADINKPILQKAYSITSEGEGDSLRTTYIANTSGPNVRIITVVGDLLKPSLIEIQYREENALYFTQRTMSLSLLNGQLSNYSIVGTQELLAGGKIDYELQASVIK